MLDDPQEKCPPILHLNLVKLISVRTLNRHNEPQEIFRVGEPIRVEIEVDSRVEKENIVVGVQIHHETGVHIATTTNYAHLDQNGNTKRTRFDLHRSRQIFTLEFPALFLGRGRYALGVGISPKPKHFTEADQLLRVRSAAYIAISRSDRPRFVFYDPPCTWSKRDANNVLLTDPETSEITHWRGEDENFTTLNAPQFIIVGAQKAGTTSLYHYLARHPDVIPPAHKEIHYFDLNSEKRIDWYRMHFARYFKENASQNENRKATSIITGEASPYYLFHPNVPRRLASLLPNAKILILLRNPVDRAYSHYQMAKRYGVESLSFEKAIEAEPDRLSGVEEQMARDPLHYDFHHHQHSYLARGEYIRQIRRWQRFFDPSQMMIIRTEDMRARTPDVLRNVFTFLELDSIELDCREQFAKSDYPPMEPALRKRLIDYFKPFNQDLSDHLHLDFNWT